MSAGSRNAGEPARSGASSAACASSRRSRCDVALEIVQHLLRIGGHLLLQQRLQAGGPIALAFPAQDRGADLGPPRVHLLRDGGVDLGQEIGELVRADAPDGGTAASA